MKTRTFVEVIKKDEEHVVARTKTDFGVVDIKRTFRKHTKEIRELKKQGIYCFEIQGILYWYTFNEHGIGTQYKEPENFRAEDRTTDELRRAGRKNKTVVDGSVELRIPEVKKEQKEVKKEEPKEDWNKEVKHSKFDMIKACIENDIPVYLAGPAGSGKNYTLEQISWELGLEFYFTNSVQQEYKLTGFIDAGGQYHETEFYKAFKNGGIFFLDEMDASIPEVLVLLNAAIANRYFEFPNGKIKAHKNFRVVAAGNTVGSGADEMYTGRLVLDQATLDRFAIIDFGYDRNIEMHIAKGNKELVDFVEAIRTEAETNGIRATFSYRCIGMVTKLEKTGLELKNILAIAVFKGMEKDTINNFRLYSLNNKYKTALNELQRVA
nr:MAG TPA: ATPase-like protein [Caudoviricetes sp.]